MPQRKPVLFDTSPLITLASFRVDGKTLLEALLPIVSIRIPASVASEATANLKYTDARHIRDIIDSGAIRTLPLNPSTEPDHIDLYTKLGKGERDTIRDGSAHKSIPAIFDDYLAVVVALRFGLRPILLLDMLVALSGTGRLPVSRARQFTEAVRTRYSAAFIEHTLLKLEQLS